MSQSESRWSAEDYNHITDAERDAWYAAIDRLRSGKPPMTTELRELQSELARNEIERLRIRDIRARRRRGEIVPPGIAGRRTNPEIQARDMMIIEAIKGGANPAMLARDLGITRSRVHQIVTKKSRIYEERHGRTQNNRGTQNATRSETPAQEP